MAVATAFVLGVDLAVVALRDSPGVPAAAPTRTALPTATTSPPPTHLPAAAPATTRVEPGTTYRPTASGVEVRGRVLDVQGRPVPDAGVAMTRDVGGAEALFTALSAFATLGLACATGICDVEQGRGRTDSRGEYVLYLPPQAESYTLTAGVGPSASFSARVPYRGRPTRLPDAVLWTPTVGLETTGTTARIRYAAAPPRVGSVESYAARVEASESHGIGPSHPMYSSSDVHSGDSFDARLIEDVPVSVTLTVRVHGPFGETGYTAKASARGHLRPMSRGRPCLEQGKGSSVARHSPCELTDGDLDGEWRPRIADFSCGSSGPCERSVSVDLGGVRQLGYVVARECDPFFDSIAASSDGRSWRTLMPRDAGRSSQGVCAVPVSGGARYVRVTGPAGGFFLSRSEISVFG